MIVDDLDVVDLCVIPSKADTKLVIDTNGVKTFSIAGERFEALTDPAPTGLEFDAAALTAEPAPVVRRLLLRALRQVAGSREIGLDHVEAVMAVLAGENGGVDVPGSRVELRRGKLILIQRKGVAK